MWHQYRRVVLFAGWVGLVAACGSPGPAVHSVKAPELQQQIREVYVLSNVGTREDVPREQFVVAMAKTSKACNVRLALQTVSAHDLDFKDNEERMKSFGIQHALTVRMSKGVTKKEGGLLGATYLIGGTYDAILWDVSTAKSLWRASIELKFEGWMTDESLGALLSRTLLNQLVKDRVLSTSCYRKNPPPPNERLTAPRRNDGDS